MIEKKDMNPEELAVSYMVDLKDESKHPMGYDRGFTDLAVNERREQGRRQEIFHDNGRASMSYNSNFKQKHLRGERPFPNATIQQQGSFERGMGPVRGVEDKRRNIFDRTLN